MSAVPELFMWGSGCSAVTPHSAYAGATSVRFQVVTARILRPVVTDLVTLILSGIYTVWSVECSP